MHKAPPHAVVIFYTCIVLTTDWWNHNSCVKTKAEMSSTTWSDLLGKQKRKFLGDWCPWHTRGHRIHQEQWWPNDLRTWKNHERARSIARNAAMFIASWKKLIWGWNCYIELFVLLAPKEWHAQGMDVLQKATLQPFRRMWRGTKHTRCSLMLSSLFLHSLAISQSNPDMSSG